MEARKKRRAVKTLTELNAEDDTFWFMRVGDDNNRNMIRSGSYYLGAILNAKIVCY